MQSKHLRKLAFGSLIVLGFTSLSTPIGYLNRLILARALSVEDFGLFYSALAVFWFFITFNDLGFGYSILYFVPKWIKNKQYKDVWNAFIYELILEIGTTLIIGGILLLSASWLATNYFLFQDSIIIVKVLLIYLLGNSLLSALKRIFTGLQQEYYYASIEFSRVSITAIASAILISQGESRLWVYAAIWSIVHLFLSMLYGLLFYFKNNYLICLPDWNRSLFNRMFVYALPTLMIQSVAIFTNYADTIILTIIKGATDVGIYNVFYPIASIPLFILTPLSMLLLPFYSYHIKDKTDRLNKLTLFFIKIVIFSGLYFGIFIATYATESTSLLFGEKWLSQGSNALKVLSIGFVFQLLTILYITIINGLGLIKTRLRISIIISILTVTLGIASTWMFGLVGLTSVNSIVYLTSAILFGRVVHNKLSIKVPYLFFIRIVLNVSLTALIIKLMFNSPNNFAEFILIGSLYTTIVTIIGYIVFKTELSTIIYELKKNKDDQTY